MVAHVSRSCLVYIFPDTPLRRTATRQMSGDRFLSAYAECSIEGWGDVSEEYSSAFLDRFCTLVESDTTSTSESMGRDGRIAFRDSLSQFTPTIPAWVSSEYVAALVQGPCLYLSWIGSPRAVYWGRGGTRFWNEPDSWPTQGRDGKPHEMVTKCLRIEEAETDAGMPNSAALHGLVDPGVLYLGNGSVQSLFKSSESQSFVERILATNDTVGIHRYLEDFWHWLVYGVAHGQEHRMGCNGLFCCFYQEPVA
jgi:hypothetical protein